MSKNKAVNDITDALTELIREDAREETEPELQVPPTKRHVLSLFIVSVAVLLGLVVVTQIVSSLQENIQPVSLENVPPELVVEESISDETPLKIEGNKTIQETFTKVHLGPVGCVKMTKLYSE